MEVVQVVHRRDPRAVRRAHHAAGGGPRVGGPCGPTWASGPPADGLPSGAVLEAPGVVAGLDDLAVVREAIQERGGHLGVAEDRRPFGEGQVGGEDDRGALVEPTDEVEQQLTSGLGEGQVAELVEDDEIAPGELIGEPALATGTGFGLEPVDQVDDVEEAPAGAVADAGPGDWPAPTNDTTF